MKFTVDNFVMLCNLYVEATDEQPKFIYLNLTNAKELQQGFVDQMDDLRNADVEKDTVSGSSTYPFFEFGSFHGVLIMGTPGNGQGFALTHERLH